MSTDTISAPETSSLGAYLKSERTGRHLTLRDVEQASGQDISNAYLSQLENGKIAKPSPHILYSLATLYGISYENLMERAGYVTPSSAIRDAAQKHGRAATSAISNLSVEEEKELLNYLAFIRSKRKSG